MKTTSATLLIILLALSAAPSFAFQEAQNQLSRCDQDRATAKDIMLRRQLGTPKEVVMNDAVTASKGHGKVRVREMVDNAYNWPKSHIDQTRNFIDGFGQSYFDRCLFEEFRITY